MQCSFTYIRPAFPFHRSYCPPALLYHLVSEFACFCARLRALAFVHLDARLYTVVGRLFPDRHQCVILIVDTLQVSVPIPLENKSEAILARHAELPIFLVIRGFLHKHANPVSR